MECIREKQIIPNGDDNSIDNTSYTDAHTDKKSPQKYSRKLISLKLSELNFNPKCYTNAQGLKIYECSECGEGFPKKGDLIVHLRIHTELKPGLPVLP